MVVNKSRAPMPVKDIKQNRAKPCFGRACCQPVLSLAGGFLQSDQTSPSRRFTQVGTLGLPDPGPQLRNPSGTLPDLLRVFQMTTAPMRSTPPDGRAALLFLRHRSWSGRRGVKSLSLPRPIPSLEFPERSWAGVTAEALQGTEATGDLQTLRHDESSTSLAQIPQREASAS